MSEFWKRILVVDDDPQIVSGLAALLSDEWEVRTAESGKQALTTFSDFSPDVVLLDVQLPDFSGIDLLHQFKMYSETTAVIMMSGVGNLERVIESMKLGAETFLQKPFDHDTLALTLEQVSRIIAQKRELIALKRTDAKDGERLPGEAQRFVSVFEAYRENKTVSVKRLYLERMQQVLKDVEKVIIDESAGGRGGECGHNV